jgi:SPP1 family predicted phage head-tail adaptor
MSINAGMLRHRVLIEELVAQTDTADDVIQNEATGEVDREWTAVAEVWAAIEPLSAREFIAAQATQSKVTTRITIRYRAISPSMRLVHMRRGVRSTVFNIEGVLPDKESGMEYLTLPCSAGVSVDGQ